mmetsp:Transcript_8036/g.22816  ORF Transcript_8036/g.22816 Transcript_8036/m.22816 type:complete len:155 (+) Transcript_8036:594-1058(+)
MAAVTIWRKLASRAALIERGRVFIPMFPRCAASSTDARRHFRPTKPTEDGGRRHIRLQDATELVASAGLFSNNPLTLHSSCDLGASAQRLEQRFTIEVFEEWIPQASMQRSENHSRRLNCCALVAGTKAAANEEVGARSSGFAIERFALEAWAA